MRSFQNSSPRNSLAINLINGKIELTVKSYINKLIYLNNYSSLYDKKIDMEIQLLRNEFKIHFINIKEVLSILAQIRSVKVTYVPDIDFRSDDTNVYSCP